MKKPFVLIAVAAICAAIAAGYAPSATTPNTVVGRTPSDRSGPYDFAVDDNGTPGGGTPDRVSAYFFAGPPDNATCDSVTDLYASLAPVTSGDVAVDANS